MQNLLLLLSYIYQKSSKHYMKYYNNKATKSNAHIYICLLGSSIFLYSRHVTLFISLSAISYNGTCFEVSILLKIPNDSSRLIVVILTFTDTCLYLYKKKKKIAYCVIRKRMLNVHILMLMIKLRFLLIGSTHLLSLG